jgi:uncharacterized protein (DUF2345 family)
VQKPDAAIEIFSEGPVNVTAKKDVSVTTTTGEVTIKGKKVTVEASTGLELKGATVKITGSASAELKAPSVKVAGDATAELTAGATTTVLGGMVRIN